MHHTIAFYQSLNPAAALVPIAAVTDPTVFVSGNDIRILNSMPNLIGIGALINSATATRVQLQSPSLRATINLDVEPIVNGLVFGSEPPVVMFPQSPLLLTPDEALNCYVSSNAAVVHQALLHFSDGAAQPVTGNIFTVRGTTAAAMVAGTWVNSPITLQQVLPTGNYQVVGFRARSANGVAARLVFVGASHRPGTFMVNAIGDRDSSYFRAGMLGVWGEFNTNTPPSVDFFGVTDAAQTIELDLIRVG